MARHGPHLRHPKRLTCQPLCFEWQGALTGGRVSCLATELLQAHTPGGGEVHNN